jgi:hypothetical protein
MHDKSHHVRSAAFTGLLSPFLAVRDAASGKARAVGDEHLMVDKIDLEALVNVVTKFLKRITEGVIDEDQEVQEKAMRLTLVLLKDGFLDDVDDDDMWSMVNQRALAPDAVSDVVCGGCLCRLVLVASERRFNAKLVFISSLLLTVCTSSQRRSLLRP